jgi:hypothetical protein
LSNKLYDFFKNLVVLILPAISAAYWSLSGIWDWSNPEKVTGTIAVLTVFLGAILKISANQYNAGNGPFDGAVVISTTETGKQLYSLELDSLDDLETKDKVVMRIVNTLE